jgi:hypothetical protein
MGMAVAATRAVRISLRIIISFSGYDDNEAGAGKVA